MGALELVCAAMALVGPLLLALIVLAHRMDRRHHAEWMAENDTLSDAEKAALEARVTLWLTRA